MTSEFDTKTAEFARLFDFFEQLALGGRSSELDMPMDDMRSLPLPEELELVIKNISTIVGVSKTACKALGSHPRRNTNRTSADESDDDSDDEESLARFPLGKRYPFTFKLMVHKLYRVEEWAKAVNETLKKSKMEFKPLAERDTVVQEDKFEGHDDMALANKDNSTVRFKVWVSSDGGRRGSVAGGEQRSQSVIVLGPKLIGPGSPPLKLPGSGGQSEFRALKKRCVGRRKSMNRPMNGEGATEGIGGSWVYDVAICSVEHPASTSFPTFPSSPPPLPTIAFSSYRGLDMLGTPREVPIGANMKRRLSGTLTRLLPFQQVTSIKADRVSVGEQALLGARLVL